MHAAAFSLAADSPSTIVATIHNLAYRGIFLIDPQGIVRWLAVHDLGVGRNVSEVIRVLDAFSTTR